MHVCSAYDFLEFMNSFKPIYRYCHPYPQGQWPCMFAGLLGRKEDGVPLGFLIWTCVLWQQEGFYAGLGTRAGLVTKKRDNVPQENQAFWHSDLQLVPCEVGNGSLSGLGPASWGLDPGRWWWAWRRLWPEMVSWSFPSNITAWERVWYAGKSLNLELGRPIVKI